MERRKFISKKIFLRKDYTFPLKYNLIFDSYLACLARLAACRPKPTISGALSYPGSLLHILHITGNLQQTFLLVAAFGKP